MNVRHFGFVFLMLLCTTVQLLAQGQEAVNDSLPLADRGQKLFGTHCGRCHSVHQEVMGPMLASITRKRSHEWLSRFIHDSQAVIASGDEYARFLFESYDGIVMPSFRMLSEEDITSIIQYIDRESFVRVDEAPSYELLNENSSEAVKHGHALFRDQCASCHYVHYESRYAPALGSVARRHPRSWLVPFIRNSQKVIKGGDVYANQLFETYHKRVMVEMEFLKESDVNDILDYITFVSGTSAAGDGVSSFKHRAVQPHTDQEQASTQSSPYLRMFLIVGGCIVGVFLLFLFFRFQQKA